MKRTTLISASLLLAFAGCTCGQGWRPNFLTRFNNRIHGVSNVGAPCDAGCHEAAPVPTGGCDTCGTAGSANYGGYESIGDEVPSGVSYSTVPPPNYGTSTIPGGTSTSRNMEPIRANRAN